MSSLTSGRSRHLYFSEAQTFILKICNAVKFSHQEHKTIFFSKIRVRRNLSVTEIHGSPYKHHVSLLLLQFYNKNNYSCLWLPECASQYTDNVAILVIPLLHLSRCNFLKVNIIPCKGDTSPYFSKEAFLLTGSQDCYQNNCGTAPMNFVFPPLRHGLYIYSHHTRKPDQVPMCCLHKATHRTRHASR